MTLKDKDGKPQVHKVKAFWIGRTEVTWEEADVLLYGLDMDKWPTERRDAERRARIAARQQPSERPYEPPDRNWGHAGFAAMNVHPRWAAQYCAWLSKKTGHRYRLPTEAEWVYACRAGGGDVRPTKESLGRVAWTAENSAEVTHRRAAKAPNAWGLYDMLGNVAEWVVRADGTSVAAGGSFEDEAADVTDGAREAFDAKKLQRTDPQLPHGVIRLSDAPHIGFRVVREE